MKVLTPDEIIRLHRLLSEREGTEGSLRDRGLLESAAYAPNAAFGGVECYPTVPEKAARLFYSLTKNHPFADGNKRIGLLAALVMLKQNGIPFAASDRELVELTLALASGKASYEDVLSFLKDHIPNG